MLTETFKLIVITPEKDIAGEPGLINALFEVGLQLLHLRKPAYSVAETRNLLNAVSVHFHPKIVLHSHYELLNDFNLKGAHLPEKIRNTTNTDGIKHIISTSFHTMEDILIEKMNFEYAFFSPVFQSLSKQGYKPTMEPEVLKDLFNSNRNKIRFPVIALGGITDKNILQAQDMSFNGAACIGYIWENHSPVKQLKKLQKILQD